MHRTESKNFIKDAYGNNIYTNGPPGTTVAAEEMNAIQEEISNVIEKSGLTLKTRANDTHDQMYDAMIRLIGAGFDLIITNQTQFNSAVERTGANAYQFKDQYKSIYFKNITGGYQMSGTTSILSGGDTYGDLSTNNVDLLFAENTSAYIDFADTAGYLNVNTDYCHLQNIWVRGTGSAAAAISQSFLVDAYYCVLNGCKTSDRKSSADFAGFRGSATILKRNTCRFDNCLVKSLTSSAPCYGYFRAFNVSNSIAYTIVSTGNDAYGFVSAQRVSNCFSHVITGNVEAYGFSSSSKLSSCSCDDINATTNISYGFATCDEMSGCKCEDLDGATGAKGFDSCNNVSACKAQEIDTVAGTAYGFDTCSQLSACFATDIQGIFATGYYTCKQLTGCTTTALNGTNTGTTTKGFDVCKQVSGCTVSDISGAGGEIEAFKTCVDVSACFAYNLDASAAGANVQGFDGCVNVSACRAFTLTGDAAASAMDGFNSCTAVSGCDVSSITNNNVAGIANGFDSCTQISACRANAITGGGASNGYNTCTYGSSLWTDVATNPNNDYIDTTDAAIANQFSCHPTIWT